MTADLLVRDARPGDEDAIRDLTLTAYAQYAARMPGHWDDYRRNILSTLADVRPAAQLVAEWEGAMVGTVLLYPARRDRRGRLEDPEVRLLAVAPVARGRGVGSALMQECVRRARQAGASALTLHTTEMMEAALRLYGRMGFVRAPALDFQPRPGLTIQGYSLALGPVTASPVPCPVALALGGLTAMAAAVGIGRFVYTPILPLMVEDLRMSQATAGFLASANFAGYLAGALTAASPAVRGSRRRLLLGGLAASVVTTAAMAGVSSSVSLSILRFLGGVASAFVLVSASALVLDGLGMAGRPDLSAVHFAGVGTGIAVASVLVAGLVALGGGWRMLWLASGLVALVALVLVPRLIPVGVESTPAGKPRGPAGTGRLPPFVVAYGLFGFGYIITATFLVEIVRESDEIRALEPLVWLLVGLTAAPSVALWTRISARIGIARAFAVACVMEAVGVAASVVWLAPAGTLLAAALLGGTFMGLTALGLMGGHRLARGDPGRTIALMTSAFGLGQIVGPTFAGAVHDVTGSFLVPSFVAVAALLVGALLATLAVDR